ARQAERALGGRRTWLDGAGTPEEVARFHRAAREFFGRRPWERYEEWDAVGLTLDGEGVVASIRGRNCRAPGLFMFLDSDGFGTPLAPTRARLRLVCERALDVDRLIRQ